MKAFVQKLISNLSPSYRRLGLVDARLRGLEEKLDGLASLLRQETDQQFVRLAALGASAAGVSSVKRPVPLVVTCTTIPARSAQVHLVIESIFRQSLLPDHVVLWLDHESFSGWEITPELREQQSRGLEIRYCDNIRSYKKLIDALDTWPEAVLVTADDDVVYPRTWLQSLHEEHRRHPGCVVCHRAHRILFGPGGEVLPYNQWEYETEENGPSHRLFATGSGGILYPPGSLDGRVGDRALFQSLAPREDDLWFKAMSVLRGSKVRKVPGGMMNDANVVLLRGSQDHALWRHNVVSDGNLEQIRNVFETFALEPLIRREAEVSNG